MPTEKCVLDPERDCVSLERVEALEYQFREQRDVQYKAIMEKLDCLTRTVNEIKDKSGRRWDMVVDKAIWAAIAAVIAFVLGRIGL